MNVLLDTHIILWAIAGDPNLPKDAHDMISLGENNIFYSMASVWEVTIKHMIHPEDMPISGRQFSEYCRRAGYKRLDLCEDHVFALESLHRSENAPKHNDPFDRIMIAQAKIESMLFITHDSQLPFYNEPCVKLV